MGNNKDLLPLLRGSLRNYLSIEQELISTRPALFESEMENLFDSYMWMRLPPLDVHPNTIETMIRSGVEEMPNTCLSGILVEVLEKSVPNGIDFSGMSLDKQGTRIRFCISGSVSLEELRKICDARTKKPYSGEQTYIDKQIQP